MNKSQLRSKEARVGDHDGQMGCNASAPAQVAHPTAGPGGMVASGQAHASAERASKRMPPRPRPPNQAPGEAGASLGDRYTRGSLYLVCGSKGRAGGMGRAEREGMVIYMDCLHL